MPTELQRLIYASRWAPGLEPRIGSEVRRIVETSFPRNRDSGLTALLLAHDGWFVQALEGGRPAIAAAMHRIFRDRRHGELHILSSGAVETRARLSSQHLGVEATSVLSAWVAAKKERRI